MAVNENSPAEDKILGWEVSKMERNWHQCENLSHALYSYEAAMIRQFEEHMQTYSALRMQYPDPNDAPREVFAQIYGYDLFIKSLTATIVDLRSMLDHFHLVDQMGGKDAFEDLGKEIWGGDDGGAVEGGSEVPDERG